jgi:hypothetical protein
MDRVVQAKVVIEPQNVQPHSTTKSNMNRVVKNEQVSDLNKNKTNVSNIKNISNVSNKQKITDRKVESNVISDQDTSTKDLNRNKGTSIDHIIASKDVESVDRHAKKQKSMARLFKDKRNKWIRDNIETVSKINSGGNVSKGQDMTLVLQNEYINNLITGSDTNLEDIASFGILLLD